MLKKKESKSSKRNSKSATEKARKPKSTASKIEQMAKLGKQRVEAASKAKPKKDDPTMMFPAETFPFYHKHSQRGPNDLY